MFVFRLDSRGSCFQIRHLHQETTKFVKNLASLETKGAVNMRAKPASAGKQTTYGYTFDITEDHLSEQQMEALKHTYDRLAEDALICLNAIAPTDTTAAAENVLRAAGGVAKGQLQAKERDTYALLQENYQRNEVLKKLWEEITEIPDWVDWKQIERGQEVLWRYAAPAMTGFAFQGLLGGTVSEHCVLRAGH